MYKRIPELQKFEEILSRLKNVATVEKLAEIQVDSKTSVPMLGLILGSQDPKAPVFCLYGGVHGLERIGTQVVLSYLEYLAENLRWCEQTQNTLKKIRIVAIPMVNPYGFWNNKRSNGNGVDLMRNSPVEGEKNDVAWLVGGHRYGKWLPWYRGEDNGTLETESRAVIEFTEKHAFQSDWIVSLDCHSGFGYKDRLWFPYAKTKKPFPGLPQVFQLKNLLDSVIPNHVYHIEPQSTSYCTHGDIWDHLYDTYFKRNTKTFKSYLPLTLEMGSWLWVKKNPSQFFSASGPFNPIVEHRLKRVLRRHLLLLDLIFRATASHKSWSNLDETTAKAFYQGALETWYKKPTKP